VCVCVYVCVRCCVRLSDLESQAAVYCTVLLISDPLTSIVLLVPMGFAKKPMAAFPPAQKRAYASIRGARTLLQA
jgi:hypothetical protein